MKPLNNKDYFLYIALIIILVIVSILGITIGSAKISLIDIVGSIISRKESVNKTIILSLRLPRTISSICVGGSLALSGTLMQSIFKNPMADPYIVGVSSGASLGAVIAILSGFYIKFALALPIISFIFALTTTITVYKISIQNSVSNTSILLLAGIAMTSFISSIINFILYGIMSEWEAAKEIIFWMLGSLEGKTNVHASILLPVTIIIFTVSLRYRRTLDIISLGDLHASVLGINVEKSRREIIFYTSILTSIAVSISGMIGFVGLIIPHISRLIVGYSHRRLVPVSFLIGAIFLGSIDIFIRILSPYINIKVGVVTALFGAPFFLYLLISKKRKSFY